MKRIIAPLTALALALGASAATASGGAVPADIKDKITEQLTQDGYEVRKIEMEDGAYEAYALKDGKRYEIYFNADLEITRTEQDD